MTHHHDSIVARLAEYRRHFTGEYRPARWLPAKSRYRCRRIVGDNMWQLGVLMPSEWTYYAVTATTGNSRRPFVAPQTFRRRAVSSAVAHVRCLAAGAGVWISFAVGGCFGCSRLDERPAALMPSVAVSSLQRADGGGSFPLLRRCSSSPASSSSAISLSEFGIQGTPWPPVLEHTAQCCAFLLEPLRYNLSRLLLQLCAAALAVAFRQATLPSVSSLTTA